MVYHNRNNMTKNKKNPNENYVNQIESLLDRNNICWTYKEFFYEIFCEIRDKVFPEDPWNALVIMEIFGKQFKNFYPEKKWTKEWYTCPNCKFKVAPWEFGHRCTESSEMYTYKPGVE